MIQGSETIHIYIQTYCYYDYILHIIYYIFYIYSFYIIYNEYYIYIFYIIYIYIIIYTYIYSYIYNIPIYIGILYIHCIHWWHKWNYNTPFQSCNTQVLYWITWGVRMLIETQAPWSIWNILNEWMRNPRHITMFRIHCGCTMNSIKFWREPVLSNATVRPQLIQKIRFPWSQYPIPNIPMLVLNSPRSIVKPQ